MIQTAKVIALYGNPYILHGFLPGNQKSAYLPFLQHKISKVIADCQLAGIGNTQLFIKLIAYTGIIHRNASIALHLHLFPGYSQKLSADPFPFHRNIRKLSVTEGNVPDLLPHQRGVLCLCSLLRPNLISFIKKLKAPFVRLHNPHIGKSAFVRGKRNQGKQIVFSHIGPGRYKFQISKIPGNIAVNLTA